MGDKGYKGVFFWILVVASFFMYSLLSAEGVLAFNETWKWRYPINSSMVAGSPFSVNDTGGIGGASRNITIWAQNASNLYIYCVQEDCTSGGYAIGTGSIEVAWENENTSSGSDPKSVWIANGLNASVVFHHFNDSSGHGNYTDIVGNPTLNLTGVYGAAVDYDGSDGIKFNYTIDPLINEFTFEAWIFRQVDSGAEESIIEAGNLTQEYGWRMRIDGADDLLKFRTREVGGAAVDSQSADVIDVSRWYYVVFRKNATYVDMFINGTLIDSDAKGTGQYFGPLVPLRMGVGRTDAAMFFDGLIDEARLWGRALSNTEILKNWESGYDQIIMSNNMSGTYYIWNYSATPLDVCNGDDYLIRSLILYPRNESIDFGTVNATMEMTITYTTEGSDYTFNHTTTNETLSLCINKMNTTFEADGNIQYSNSSYMTRVYFLDNDVFDNSTDTMELLMTTDVTATKQTRFRVIDQYGTPQPNMIIKPQHWYWGLNQYKNVSSLLTDERGYASTYMDLDTVWYRFLIMDEGVLKDTIAAQTIADDGSSIIDVDLVLNPTELLKFPKFYNNIVGSCSYANSTGNLTCSYTDVTGDTLSSVRLEVTRYRGYLNTTVSVCSLTNTTVPNGSFICHIGNESAYKYTHTYSMLGSITQSPTEYWVITNGVLAFNEWITGLLGNCHSTSDVTRCGEGAVMAFFLTLTAALIGAFSPPVGITLALVGLAGSSLLGLWAISIYNIIGLAFVAAVIIWKMR